MIIAKSKEEIKIMKEGGQKLKSVKEALRKMVGVGVTSEEIDREAESLIAKVGGKPSFKTVKNYYWSTCININDGVVHGIPGKAPFKNGDIVSIDVGLFYKGFHTDTSFTVSVGEVPEKVERFLETGKKALRESIARVRAGNKISDISKTMQSILKAGGYSPVEAVTGHGIGKSLHEEPHIHCFWKEGMRDEEIPEGASFAIEVIYMEGLPDLVLLDDGWTLATKDGKIAALFEETVVATGQGPRVLTE